MNSAALRKPKWLRADHFNLMNDLTFFPQQYKRTLMLENTIDQTYKSGLSQQTIVNGSSYNLFGLDHFFSNEKKEKLKKILKKIKRFLLKQRLFKFLQRHTKIYDPTKPLMIFWDFLILLVIAFFFDYFAH